MSETTGAPATPGAAASSAAPAATTASTPAVSTPAPAIAAPASGTAPDPQGPIPYDRHKSILDGAYKERDSATTERNALKQKLEELAWVSQFNDNPFPYVDSWVDQLAAHPQFQAQMLAKAERLLNARRGSQVPQQSTEEPQPDILTDTGQPVYSAPQNKKWQDWNWAQREATLGQRLQPLETLAQEIQQQRQQAQYQAQTLQSAQSTLEKLRATSPRFTKHEAEIKKFFIEHEEFGDNVHLAYSTWLEQHALPKEQATVLESLQTQASGGTVNPGQTAPSQAPKFKDFGDALRYYAEHPDEATVMAKR